MLDQLNEIEKAALESLSSITDQAALDAWRVAKRSLHRPRRTSHDLDQW